MARYRYIAAMATRSTRLLQASTSDHSCTPSNLSDPSGCCLLGSRIPKGGAGCRSARVSVNSSSTSSGGRHADMLM